MSDFTDQTAGEGTTVQAQPSAVPTPVAAARRQPMQWTVEGYVAAISKGVFPSTLRAELIAGEILEKMPIGDVHAYIMDCLMELFVSRATNKFVVRMQGPMVLSETSRPEPDGLLADLPRKAYATRSPTASQVPLVCEVADSSLAYDRSTKLSLYAAAGITEYWILNAIASELEQHTQPRADGTYAAKVVYGVADTLTHPQLGEVVVAELFPPVDAAPEADSDQ